MRIETRIIKGKDLEEIFISASATGGMAPRYQAQELFFCGTGCQVAPIVSVDHRTVGDGKPGRYTREVQGLFFDIVRGKNSRYIEWLREV